MSALIYSLLFFLSYILGSIPTAFWIVKTATGKDIRHEGTGNVGAMNTARATGKWYLFVLVAILDAIKGGVAISLAYAVKNAQYDLETGLLLAAFGVILGHCYSIYFKMKDGTFAGGKAIASLGGVLWMLHFNHLLLPWLVAMVIPILLTGNLFLGQFTGTLALPIIALFLAPEHLVLSILIAIPIFIKQWPRVIPMLEGKEPKWYWKKRS